jgi:hypothetical protein
MNRPITKTPLSQAFIVVALLISLSCVSKMQAAERSLAGIRIFSPISVVLNRYGNPTFLTSGDTIASISFTSGQPIIVQPGQSSMTTSFTGTDAAGLSSIASTPEVSIDPLYDHGSRYYYDIHGKGIILEFVSTSNGRIVEIKLIGYHSSFQTSLGIGLGSTYKEILLKYGYPEETINENETDGDYLTLIYTKRDHVAFRLVRNRLAEISVVAPD